MGRRLSRIAHGVGLGDHAVRGLLRRNPRGRRVLCVLAWVALVLIVVDRIYPPSLPSVDAGMVIVARDGTPLRTWPDAAGVWRYAVNPDQVSNRYLEALLAYEDRAFWWHPGVNPFSFLAMGAARPRGVGGLDPHHAGGADS